MLRLGYPLLLSLLFVTTLLGDGPRDNVSQDVRPIPPPGVKIPDDVRAELTKGVERLGQEIEVLRAELGNQATLLALLPDVQIYHKAVHDALKYDEFFNAKEFAGARELLQRGMERAAALSGGKAPWNVATGLVVRGYVSKIDGSVQPYGLVVPASYQPNTPHKHRLDVWCHGRGETLSELNFIDGRQKSPGEFTPAHAFVLHPYGRYCNANKFAGEIDLFEALADVKKHYPIDDDRIVMRGFSMGGAACWQFAVHYADQWAAAAPGAGFAETAEFLRVFQDEKVQPPDYEKKLWRLYDCTESAMNLFHCPTVAYSGENDKQKQAADVMAKSLASNGIDLVHVIGPKTGHSYHPVAKEEINRRIDTLAERGRERTPSLVKFTTWTLRYPQMHWVRVEGLDKHWERATVEARLEANGVHVKTQNVSALTLDFAPGHAPFVIKGPRIFIDDVGGIPGPPPRSDRSWTAHLRKVDGKWTHVPALEDGVLRKRPGLQGPIDDAFMDSFVMVQPTGQPLNDATGQWVAREMQHAITHWRLQFRGEPRVKKDVEITDAEVAAHNLVLWGDPSSNQVLAKLADKLPIVWSKDGIGYAGQTYHAGNHVPLLIYPNPLNPKRYVVLNSGFTHREYDYLNNARQTPKLPDYAILNASIAPTSRTPGGIVTAGFFNEEWK